jgi:peptidoglycan/LPS O-acetylase OafA/YrhL
VYIWQQVFLNCFNTTWTGVFPMALVVGLAAGEVSYWFIETPVLRWARGRRGGR